MYAIIDIGSNTIRLNVYQVKEDGAIHSIFQSKETAGLAGYVREDGSMSREGLDRAQMPCSASGPSWMPPH